MKYDDNVRLAHGAGGPAMRKLVEGLLLAELPRIPGAVDVHAMDDGAALPFAGGWLVITTDAHVVKPAFFPGGDIGILAVSGTVNDLAMMGATEVLALTCGLILEEGYPLDDLARVQASIAATCRSAAAPIVTGDTKVMGRGEIDGIAIHTTGIAWSKHIVRDCQVRPGDALILTGTAGDHGLAVLAARHALDLAAELRSDVAPLNDLVRQVLQGCGEHVHAMKDPTRGGVASAVHEMAAKSGVEIQIDEVSVPIAAPTRAAAALLGIDPLQVANEGKALLAVDGEAAATVLAILHAHPLGQAAAVIGRAHAGVAGRVVLDTGFGRRWLNESDGEALPRIC